MIPAFDTPEVSPINTGNRQRTTRSNADIMNIRIPFVVTKETPIKSVNRKINKLAEKIAAGEIKDVSSHVLVDRSQKCQGILINRIGSNGKDNGPGSRSTCARCGSQTHTYCLKCKQWLCDKPSDNAKKLDDWQSHIIINQNSGNPIHFRNNCFFAKHQKMVMLELEKYCQETN